MKLPASEQAILTALDAEFLRSELLRVAREADAILVDRDAYGERYTVDSNWFAASVRLRFSAPGSFAPMRPRHA